METPKNRNFFRSVPPNVGRGRDQPFNIDFLLRQVSPIVGRGRDKHLMIEFFIRNIVLILRLYIMSL